MAPRPAILLASSLPAPVPISSAVSCSRRFATSTAGAPGHVTASGFRVDSPLLPIRTAGRIRRQPPDMFRRYAFGFAPVRQLSTMSSSATPIEDAIRSKVTAALKPSTFEIHNDSHLHVHHKPMKGNTSTETHFRLVITSEAFRSKMKPARHRMIYALLRDEMSRDNGIHALQLRTLTPEEEEREKQKEAEKAKKSDEQTSD